MSYPCMFLSQLLFTTKPGKATGHYKGKANTFVLLLGIVHAYSVNLLKDCWVHLTHLTRVYIQKQLSFLMPAQKHDGHYWQSDKEH